MTKKEAYVEKLQAHMNKWDSEIVALEARASEAAADAKIGYFEQIDKLKKHQLDAQAKLDDLRQSGDSAWEDMKAGVEQSWNSLEKAVNNAASRFSA